MDMATLLQSNPYLRDLAAVYRRITVNARESSAFEGVRISARDGHIRPLSTASAKKLANGRQSRK